MGGNIEELNTGASVQAQVYSAANTSGPDPVDTAVDNIQDWLDQSWRDWDVTKGDLNNIRDTLDGLTPEQRNDVIGELSDRDLERWSEEMNGLNGGYSLDEQRDVYTMLAGSLDGDQLARVVEAADGDRSAELAGEAIGTHATHREIVSFVENTAGRVENDDSAARAVANAFGGLEGDGANVTRALEALSPAQRQAIVEAGAGESLHTSYSPYGGSVSISYDAAPLGRFLDAVASSGDAGLKAEVFNHTVDVVSGIRDNTEGWVNAVVLPSFGDGTAIGEIYDGLGAILESDPAGVIDAMANQGYGMRGLTDFAEIAVKRGDFDRLGEIAATLRDGPAGTDAFDHFGRDFDPTSGEDFRNAEILGFYVGAVQAGAINVNADDQANADLAASLLTGGIGLAAVPMGVGGKLALGAGSMITEQAVGSIVSGAQGSRNEFVQATVDAAMPRDGDGNLPRGDERGAFTTAASEVLNANLTR